jgi:hypothetical protein
MLSDIAETNKHPTYKYAKTCNDAKSMTKGNSEMVFCDPLNKTGKYTCPPEAEVRKTGNDIIYTPNPDDPDIAGWCVPKIIASDRPKQPAKKKELSKIARLEEIVNTITEEFPQLEEASRFTWETPCEDNTNQASCYVIRKPPKVEQGDVIYGKYGEACVWRPWEDPTYNPNDPDKPKCMSVDKINYKREALDKEAMDTINANLAMHGVTDTIPHIDTGFAEFGDKRRYITDQHRDIKKGYASVPIFATAFTLLRVIKTLYIRESAFPKVVGNHPSSKRKREQLKHMARSLPEINARIHKIVKSMYNMGMHVGTYLPAADHTAREEGLLVIYDVIDQHMGKNIMKEAHDFLVADTLDIKKVEQFVNENTCHVDDMAISNGKVLYEKLCKNELITKIFKDFDSALHNQTVGEYVKNDNGALDSTHFMVSTLLPDSFSIDPDNNQWKVLMDNMQTEWLNFAVVGIKRQTVLANKIIRHVRSIEEHLRTPGVSVFANGSIELMAACMGVPQMWRQRNIPDFADPRVVWSRDDKSISVVPSGELREKVERSDVFVRGDFVTSVTKPGFKGYVDKVVPVNPQAFYPRQYITLHEPPSSLGDEDTREYMAMSQGVEFEMGNAPGAKQNTFKQKNIPRGGISVAHAISGGGNKELDEYFNKLQLRNENNLRVKWAIPGESSQVCPFPLDRVEYMYTRFDHNKREYGYMDSQLENVHTPKMLITYRRESAVVMVCGIAASSCFGNLYPVLREAQTVGLKINDHTVRWRYNIGTNIHIPTYTEINQPPIDMGEGVVDSVKTMQQIETTSSLNDKLLFESEIDEKLRTEVALQNQAAFNSEFADMMRQLPTHQGEYEYMVENIPRMLVHGINARQVIDLLIKQIELTFNDTEHPCYHDKVIPTPAAWKHDLPILLGKRPGDVEVRTREHLALTLYYVMRSQFVYVQAEQNTDQFRAYIENQVRKEVLDNIKSHKGAIPRHLGAHDKLTNEQRRLWHLFYTKQSPSEFEAFVKDLSAHRVEALRSDLRVPFDNRAIDNGAYHLELNKMLFEDFIRYVYKNPQTKKKKGGDVRLSYTLSLSDAQIDQNETEYGPRTWAWMKTSRVPPS